METQIYKLDENQFGSLKKRFLFRKAKLAGLTYLFVGGMMYLEEKQLNSGRIVILALIFSAIISSLATYWGINKLMKGLRTFQITLNEAGVEAKGQMMLYKFISWNNLLVKEKKSGEILLSDASIPAFNRKMNGTGCILIQPEILNRDNLLIALRRQEAKSATT